MAIINETLVKDFGLQDLNVWLISPTTDVLIRISYLYKRGCFAYNALFPNRMKLEVNDLKYDRGLERVNYLIQSLEPLAATLKPVEEVDDWNWVPLFASPAELTQIQLSFIKDLS